MNLFLNAIYISLHENSGSQPREISAPHPGQMGVLTGAGAVGFWVLI